MRPLAIWAMQWALSKPKLFEPELTHEVSEDDYAYSRHDAGFAKVARLLKLPKEEEAKSLLQLVYDFTCRRLSF